MGNGPKKYFLKEDAERSDRYINSDNLGHTSFFSIMNSCYQNDKKYSGALIEK